MARRQVVFATTAMAAVILSACSKSEDVPPGRRLFGDPPQIEVVQSTPESQQLATATCDVTEYLRGFLCVNGIPPDVEFSAPVILTTRYTQVTYTVTVSDPQGVENLLFVGASYVKPDSTEEATLVLFDDGSENRFPQSQVDSNLGGQDCTILEEPMPNEPQCSCQGKVYEVTSNDANKTDGKFTRAMAFVPQGPPPIAQDCIMVNHEQVPIATKAGVTLTFRIDAVDRDGNLDTWDNEESVLIRPFQATDFTCAGDPCGCCIYANPNNYPTRCGACEGTYSGGVGVCQSAFTGGCCIRPEDCPEE